MNKHIFTLLVAALTTGYAQAQITDTGDKVGIGTTTPVSKLTISNNAAAGHLMIQTTDNPASGSQADIDFQIISTKHTVARISSFYADSNENGYGGLHFWTRSQGSLQKRLTIDHAGNVGIGTENTRGYKLAVVGPLICERATVKLKSNWPDFVFDSTYKLPSLEETALFIDANKHLPGVPTAAAIDKDGLDIGEMNRILLQKVEELTLYLIELKKDNQTQKSRITELEKAVNGIK
jgi:hypothetical protein